MKAYLALLALVTLANAVYIPEVSIPGNTAYGYLKNVAIPEGERIRKAEEAYLNNLRIVGGVPASNGQYPYQAGLLLSIIGSEGTGICGGSLISSNRVLTAAHCWYDGVNQVRKVTVVLGSVLLFSGGQRLESNNAVVHNYWIPQLVRNDLAVIYLPSAAALSDSVFPIALPSGDDLKQNFVGVTAIASGFGLTADGGSITTSSFLSHVRLNIISNGVCSIAFPLIVQSTNICTSGIGGIGTCNGDSGGPLVANRNGRNILIGVTSFGSAFGCQSNLPAAFTRVTSYVPFINEHLDEE